MATALARYALRTATAGSGGGGSRALGSKRNYASSARPHDHAYEAEKWEKITYAGIFTCTILAIYNLSKPHRHHYEEPPPYPYLRSRQKDIPPSAGV